MLSANVSKSVTDRWENDVVFTHPYHVGKSCSKFGLIPLSSLGGDSVTDRQVDGKIILLSHTLTTRGSHAARSVEFRPVV